ncbi:MAG: LysR family transcriptional regulator [Catenulispora sp.]|nr:LysR family transcriptional regulator [Catenulispora sp.]
MDLSLLEAFREVAVRGSLTAAAQALGYTQPAISRQISALEHATGTRLFDRLPRGVRLTEEGRCLLSYAETVLDQMDAARRALEGLRTLKAGWLRAGAFASANAALMPGALAAFHAAHPDVALTVSEGTTAVLLEKLQGGVIDLAVISLYPHQVLGTDRFALRHLLDDPLMVALPHGHRLDRAGGQPLRLVELAEESWVEGFPDASQTLVDACRRAGFQPKIDFTVREWTAKQGYVAAGLGLALVPSLAAATMPAGIVLRPLHPQDAPVRSVYATTLVPVTPPATVTAFQGHLEASARALVSYSFSSSTP